MKKTIDVIKMFLCFAVIAMVGLGCSNSAILSGTDAFGSDQFGAITQISEFDGNDGYVSVELQLPEDIGRGWKIEEYVVTATRGDDKQVFKSSSPKLSVKLKVGTWYFAANAQDKYGNILYSAGSSATIGLNSSRVYIGLLKRVGQLKVSMNIDNIVTGAAKPQRYEVKAVRGQDFLDVTGDVHSVDDTITLSGLAQGTWTLTCIAYSAPSDNPTGEATVPFYKGTVEEVEVEAGQSKSVSIDLAALKVAPPLFSHDGQVKVGTEITISSQQSGAKIYVTTGSGEPTEGACDGIPSNPYILKINGNTTVKAAAYLNGKWSDCVTKIFTVVAADKCVAPQIKPESQTIIGTGYCTIECQEDGAVVYYTTDGSTPTTSSALYEGKFPIDKEMTVKAMAVKSGLANSDVVSVSYGYKSSKCAAPTIDPINGTFTPGQIITISQNTTGSVTYYLISDNPSDTANASGDSTKSFANDRFDIDTTLFKAGTYYITAFSRIEGRDDSDMTKAEITISSANQDDNVIYMCIDNIIVTTREANMYKEVGTMPSNSTVWYGFTCDAGANVYVDVEPAETVSAELYKNGQNSNAKLTLKNNIAMLPPGDNYYYLKLTASSISSGVRVRVYTTTEIGGKTLESLEIAANPKSVQVGNTLSLTAIAHYSDNSAVSTITPAKWTVSDESIATVSGKTLTAHKEGTVKLTAEYTDDGVTKTSNELTITVTPAVVTVTLDALSITIAADSSESAPKFKATAYYSDGSSKNVTSSATWTSNKTSVATVSNGVVSLKGAGTAVITSSYKEGNVTKSGADQTITVTQESVASGMAVYVLASYDEMNPQGCIYAWNDQKALYGDWPGAAMTKTSDNEAYYYIIYNAASIGNLIFNNNNGGKQTPDLTMPNATSGHWQAYWNNSKNGWDWKEYEGTAKAPISSGNGELKATIESGVDPNPTTTTTTTTLPPNGLRIYVKSSDAPTIWAWESNSGTALSEKLGESWPGEKMTDAVGMNDSEGWYMKDFSSVSLAGKGTITFKLNGGGSELNSQKTKTFWYDGQSFLDTDPTKPKDPVKPTVTLSPNNGSTVRTTGSISVTFTNGYSTITSAKVTINGTEHNMGTTAGTWSKTLAELGITTDGDAITVSASVTNAIGTTTASANYTSKLVDPSQEDTFTWDNVNAYFVLTDRFYNGDHDNDHSYGRHNSLNGDEDVATFHGGDLKGLTQKMDYFKNLGINAIWITAPYEQAHGWVGGKDGKFPHYAFHGYYTLDWTALDANMGTLDEFRAFVTACHANGIRVIMDVVMNHVGYNNLADMITYPHGSTTVTDATWIGKTDGQWIANVGIDWSNDKWENWFGPWISSFAYDRGPGEGGSCGGLPDVRTELTTSVGMAPVLVTKWNKDTADHKSKYYNPSVANVDWNGWSGNFRTDKNVAPAIYQEVWLSAWVREFGIDGFRCDTAKHVEKFRWGELKRACQAALEAWRNDDSKVDTTGAKDWDENFWMTGEHWGWTSKDGQGEYYTTGGFDSMINFSFNGGNSWDGNYRTNYPKADSWGSYLSINNNGDGDNNGNRNNVLTYISSHDTGLTRVGNQKAVGTGLVLLPGGVQIYYGDESYREKAYTGCGDGDMYTRGNMNWNGGLTGSASNGTTNDSLVAHWGKIGRFRKFNPAVGAGKGSATKRTYNGPAGDSKIAIGVSGTTVDVSGLWDNGTTVYNWYDGTSAEVCGGSVSFSGGTMDQPILVSDKNPTNFQ